MMRRAVIDGAGKPLRFETCALPSVPARGALVEIHCAGICHTDVHVADDEMDMGHGQIVRLSDTKGDEYLKIVPGHEISGVVIALGDEVSSTKCPAAVGDRVIVYPWLGCQKCGPCTNGFNQICEIPFESGLRKDLGVSSVGGGFATHCLVPDADYLVKLPKEVPLDVGAMLACSGLTAYTTLARARPTVETARKCRGSARILIIGAGGLGTWGAQLSKAMFGAENVQVGVADISGEKLEAMPANSADVKLHTKGDAKANEELVISQYGHVDVVVDFVGNPATTALGLACLYNGGTVFAVGLWGGATSVTMVKMILSTASLSGNLVGPLSALQELVSLVSRAPIHPPKTVAFKLDDVNKGLQQLKSGSLIGRGVVYKEIPK